MSLTFRTVPLVRFTVHIPSCLASSVPPFLFHLLLSYAHVLSILMAPKAVVHETVYPKVHHVREEIYTREIHDEHIYDRILPIIDVQVLPAKHFAPMGPNGEFVEVPAAAVAARGGGPTVGRIGSLRRPSRKSLPAKVI